MYGEYLHRQPELLLVSSTPCLEQAFSEAVDISAVLTQRQIDHIDVSDTRLLVIYANAIINIEVHTGTIETAEKVTIEILEEPSHETDDIELILSNISDLLHSE